MIGKRINDVVFVLEVTGKMEEVPAAGHGYTCCALTLFGMPITAAAVMPRREDDSFIITYVSRPLGVDSCVVAYTLSSLAISILLPEVRYFSCVGIREAERYV